MPCHKEDGAVRTIASKVGILIALDSIPRDIRFAVDASELIVRKQITRRLLLKVCKS